MAYRRENTGRIERHRRLILRRAGPLRAKRSCKTLRLGIARAGERIDRPSVPAGHLRDDMAGRTEAEDAEMLSIARHHQRAPADQAGTQHRRDGDIVAGLAVRKTIAGVGDEMRGKAAVARVTGKARA